MSKTNRREFMRAAGFSATTGLMATAHPLAAATASEPQVQPRPASMGAQLRQLLLGPEPILTFGFADIHSARLAELAGLKCLFLGGSVESEIYAIPNIGMISMTELLELHQRIAWDINIPIIADVDDLGGNPLSIYRNTKLFERAGLGAVYFEDIPQTSRVRYSTELFSKEQMVTNIRAALDARDDLVICVNCYAQQTIDSNEKFEEAVERGMAYVEAGAEVLTLGGARTVEESKRFSDLVGRPLLTGTLVGTGPGQVPTSRMMRDAGVMIGVFETPAVVQGAARRAVTELMNTGALSESREMALTRLERDTLLGRSEEYRELARQYRVIP